MVGPSVLRSKAVSPAIREAAREGDELAELRKQIQAGMGGADAPITPSLSTEGVASRMRQRGNLDKRTEEIKALADMRKAIKAGMGGADAPITPSLSTIENIPLVNDILNPVGRFLNKEVYPAIGGVAGDISSSIYNLSGKITDYTTGSKTPRINISDSLGLPSYFLGNEKDAADKANTVPPEAVTMYGQGDVGDMLSEERSRIAAALPKQSAAAASAVSDEMPSNAEMAGYRAGLAEFKPLTSDTEAVPSTAPSTDKEEVAVAKQATNTFAQLPGSEIRDKLSKEFETLAASRKARLDARKKGLDSDRWLTVANLGASILAQPGGQTFLQAIGKGAKESGIIASLSKLNREEADIAGKLDTIDVDTLMKKYQLSKDEAAEFARKRTEDRLDRKLNADINYNTDRINLLKQQGKVEEAKLLLKRNEELRKSISAIGKPLTQEQFKNVKDVYKGYWSEISKTDKGKSIQELLDKTKINLDSDQNITHLYKSARLIEQYEGLDQRSAYLKALNNFLKGISPAKKQ